MQNQINDLWLKTLTGILQCGHKLGLTKIDTQCRWEIMLELHKRVLYCPQYLRKHLEYDKI